MSRRRGLFAGGSFTPTTFTASRANMSDVSRYVSGAGAFNPVFNGNSRFVATTSATSMTINWNDDVVASNSFNQLSVYVTQNGVRTLIATVTPVPNGTTSSYVSPTIPLPDGPKTVEVINGPTAEATPFGQGSWNATQMTSVTFSDTAVFVPDNTAASPRMILQGTSIECGYDGNPTSQFGMGELMRNGLSGVDKYPGPVVVDAYGGGEVYHDWFQASGVNSVATMLTQMTGLGNITDWIIPLATNDWTQSQWTPTAMGTALIAEWPTVKAVYTNAKLWLVGCPHRVSETTPNGLGFTLQNYRDQGPIIVAGLPAGQAAYFNVEPFIPFNATYFNADGVHLTNAGQALYAQLVMTGIGR